MAPVDRERRVVPHPRNRFVRLIVRRLTNIAIAHRSLLSKKPATRSTSAIVSM